MIDKIGQKMVEPLLDGLFSFFENWIVTTLDILLSYFTKDFAPDMKQFIEFLGSNNVTSIQNILMYTGIGLASVIFLFNIFMQSFPQLKEDRDPISAVFLKYVVSLLLIGSGIAFLEEWILSTAMFIYNWIGEITIDASSVSEFGSSYIHSVVDSMALDRAIPGMSILLAILTIIFAITIIINFFKFALEVIERYVVMCFLVLCFPIAASCYASSGTKRIFTAYWRMLLSEIAMLVLNKLFIVGFLAMAGTAKVLSTGVLGFAFVIAYLRFAQRADAMLRSLGLNTAQTGGALLDDAKNALSTGIMAARVASSGVSTIAGVAGASMQSSGVKSDNFGKFSAGQRMSDYGHNKTHSDSQNLKNFAAAGGKLNPDEDYARETAARAAMTSGYKDLANMPQAMQEAVIKQTLGNDLADVATQAGYENASLSNITVSPNGDIRAKMNYGDGREMSISLSKTPPRDPITNIGSVTDIAGNQMYLSRTESTNDIINKARQDGTLNANNPDVMEATNQMVHTNGLNGLKNMPSDIQAKAFTAAHGAGFNKMSQNAGLGITSDDIHNISVDNGGNVHGTASISGRDMNLVISPNQPTDTTSLIGAYTDDDGRMHFVTATPPGQSFDDIEYGNDNTKVIGSDYNEPSSSFETPMDSANHEPASSFETPMDSVHREPSSSFETPMDSTNREPASSFESPMDSVHREPSSSFETPMDLVHNTPNFTARTHSDGTNNNLSYTDLMMHEEGFDELFDTQEPISNIPNAKPLNDTMQSTNNFVSEQKENSDTSLPNTPSQIPTPEMRRNFLQPQKSASEVAAGVTLDRGWKAANSIHLEGARFTSTANGGVELRNYDNHVMMYQDPKGFQHYSFGTKTPNDADFRAGGTYESAGYQNVKITGRFPDGSFSFEADSYDKKGNPARSKYIAQDYAKHHDQPGRIVQGNRIHQSLLVKEVNARKELFGKGSDE